MDVLQSCCHLRLNSPKGKSLRYQFRPQVLTTLVAIVLMAVMIKLGFWQYNKAAQKQALQNTYNARVNEPAIELPTSIERLEEWRYRRVQATGTYLKDYQVFLDNQVEGDEAGYHVITPFRAENGATVLVDRGWIPAGDRSKLPVISTPTGKVTVAGFSWIPSSKFFELSAPANAKEWQPLWQNMDMPRYMKLVPFKVHPFVIRLDANSQAGGFVRNWVMPAERIEMHIGYAYQWWGFSAALFAIWIFVNLKRKDQQ
jgi:surfeit locus 1 family protein